jgi:hypothetical protein
VNHPPCSKASTILQSSRGCGFISLWEEESGSAACPQDEAGKAIKGCGVVASSQRTNDNSS